VRMSVNRVPGLGMPYSTTAAGETPNYNAKGPLE